jgi:hypothetical protein
MHAIEIARRWYVGAAGEGGAVGAAAGGPAPAGVPAATGGVPPALLARAWHARDALFRVPRAALAVLIHLPAVRRAVSRAASEAGGSGAPSSAGEGGAPPSSAPAAASPRVLLMTALELWVRAVSDTLGEVLYEASCAGVEVSVDALADGRVCI